LNARLYSAVVAYGRSFDYREEIVTEYIALNKFDDARLKKIHGSIRNRFALLHCCRPSSNARQICESDEPCIRFVGENDPVTASASDNIM
jgi:hypothetical protein